MRASVSSWDQQGGGRPRRVGWGAERGGAGGEATAGEGEEEAMRGDWELREVEMAVAVRSF
ncbi:hypothetical protein M5K25_016940 [Dendrobium thyrsiflorum]|uniref:Uncharacterized protein n=1 Tax=Dendrobium thyrsiflorum TaxID=117978 RepID=A0ABD0USX6_DENTH